MGEKRSRFAKLSQVTRVLPFVYVGRIEGEHVAFGRRPEDLSVGYLVEFTAQRAQ